MKCLNPIVVNFFVAGLAMLGIASQAFSHDKTLYVRNQGVDSASCGDAQNACRSIGQAINNASSGDVIFVGPGRYGDLNGDNAFAGPGEERLQRNATDSCVICIRKSIQLYSLFGAEVTIVEGPLIIEGPVAVLEIFASGVSVGNKGHGFTFRGGDRALVANDGLDYVRVVGNIASRNGYAGFSFVSPGRFLLVSDNVSINVGGRGFLVYGGTDGASIFRNVADGSGYAGFQVAGSNLHQVVDNVASNNFIGFEIEQRTLVKNNSAISNRVGIHLSGVDEGNQIVGNTIVGNDETGIEIISASSRTEIKRNNIYGNGVAGINTAAGHAVGCGIVDYSGPIVVSAANNYWGAASGPGVDPADKAGPGSGCDLAGSRTQVQPFAKTAFPVSP